MATLPHGSWPTPITSELVVRAARAPGDVAFDGADVWWSESRPEEGGRNAVLRRSADGTVDRGARRAVERPDGGPRVRRRCVVGARRRAVVRRLGHATPPPPRRGRRRAGAADPGARRRSRPALRGRRRVARRLDDPVRAGVPRRRRRGRQHDRAPGGRRAVRPRGRRRGSRLRVDAALAPRRDGVVVARVGPPRHAVGRDAPRRVRRRRPGRSSPAATSAESICQADWAPDGSLWFSGDRSGFWSLYRWTRRDRRRGDGRARPGRRLPALGVRRVVLRVPRRRARRVRRHRRGAASSSASSSATAGSRCSTCRTRRSSRCARSGTDLLFIGASPTSEAHVVTVAVDTPRGGPPVALVPPRDLGLDATWFSTPDPVDFPTADGATAHALVYWPRNPTVEAPARRAAAAARDDPQRPDRGRPGHAAARRAVLDEPRHRRRRRQLPRLDRATAGPTATCCRASGASPTSRTAPRSPASSSSGATSTPTGCASAAARPAGSRCSPRSPSRTSSRSARATTASPTSARWPPTRTSSRAATWTGWSGRGPRPRTSTTSARRSTTSTASTRPLIVFQGLEDDGRPAEPVGDDRRRRARQGRAGRVPDVRGRAARLPPGRETIRTALDAELAFFAEVLGFDLPVDEGIVPIEIA